MLTFLLTLIGSAFGAYYGNYLREKGKNLATREDIGHITSIVEDIKNQHAKELEALKAHQQMRVAALDRRLEAHQEAFALWRRLYATAHEDGIRELVKECQTWWEKNCLYLEPAAREAFSKAYIAAGSHQGYLRMADPDRSSQAVELIMRNWQAVEDAGNIIVESVALPGLTNAERETLAKAAQKAKNPEHPTA
ncbi:hypothetical protein PTKU64_06830 [Paraburkholderia terrae]|uniref:Uncharacterized protein n=1 Tax=Paraburkholderia terrae TaxID=311230 RepID=A0ABM7TDS2_9BURK|nr:hypothetical protein [Paraburkholderia terrae]BCZ77008.1 hypothetical protein PTKU64_06830 [Paraburkholderia terrae]